MDGVIERVDVVEQAQGIECVATDEQAEPVAQAGPSERG
jgi:hypothetical protein